MFIIQTLFVYNNKNILMPKSKKQLGHQTFVTAKLKYTDKNT